MSNECDKEFREWAREHPTEVSAVGINALLDEIDRLQDILDDYRQDTAKVLDERCPTDERHCGCVPILRNQIANYQNALVLITTFPSSKQQTFAESQMQKVAFDALDYRAGSKIDAAKYWVEKVRSLEADLALAYTEVTVEKQKVRR